MAFDNCILPQGNIKLQQQQNDLLVNMWKLHSTTIYFEKNLTKWSRAHKEIAFVIL
jgi:hypothetical protein